MFSITFISHIKLLQNLIIALIVRQKFRDTYIFLKKTHNYQPPSKVNNIFSTPVLSISSICLQSTYKTIAFFYPCCIPQFLSTEVKCFAAQRILRLQTSSLTLSFCAFDMTCTRKQFSSKEQKHPFKRRSAFYAQSIDLICQLVTREK